MVKTNISTAVDKVNCNICDQTMADKSTLNDHMNWFHKKEIIETEDLIKVDSIDSLKKKVKNLESQLKESEEKRKKSILDQHEAEYATRKIRSENEKLKIENNCMNNLLDLQKSKMEATLKTNTSPIELAPEQMKKNITPIT